MPLMAAALLAAGCTKEVETPGLRIIEKSMTGRAGNSKVAVDFTDLTHNTWMAGGAASGQRGAYCRENIFIAQGSSSNNVYAIQESEGNYYIDYSPTDDFSAAYPTTTNQSSTSVSIPFTPVNYVLRYITSGTYAGKCQVQFPMAAFGHSGDKSVTFHHATGAIAFDIVNNIGSLNIKSIVITALDENDAAVGLWGRSYNGSLTCTSNGNGINVTNDGTFNYTTFYPNNDQNTEVLYYYYCHYYSSLDERIHVVVPIPATPRATKFQIAIYQAEITEENGERTIWDQGDLIIQRTTPLMDIGLNEIHKLGDFYLAN